MAGKRKEEREKGFNQVNQNKIEINKEDKNPQETINIVTVEVIAKAIQESRRDFEIIGKRDMERALEESLTQVNEK